MNESSFVKIARRSAVYRRATHIALIVGPLLAIINHADKMATLSMDVIVWLKIILTFVVPYSVSTWTSVMAVREAQSKGIDM